MSFAATQIHSSSYSERGQLETQFSLEEEFQMDESSLGFILGILISSVSGLLFLIMSSSPLKGCRTMHGTRT
jgi:hypothetical protein